MFNHHLTLADSIVITYNIILCLLAAVANFAAAKVVPKKIALVKRSTAVLASIYCLGYSWLLFDDLPVAEWSSIFRGVSLLSWPIVWIWPALSWTKLLKDLHQDHKES